MNIFAVEKTKIKKKEAGNGPIFLKKEHLSIDAIKYLLMGRHRNSVPISYNDFELV